MNTECTATQLEFQSFGRRRVSSRFDGGRLTSDGDGGAPGSVLAGAAPGAQGAAGRAHGGRVAYGIALRRDRLLTPFSEYSITGGSARQVRLGVRLQRGWELELTALRQERAPGETPDYGAELRFTFLDW